MGSFVEKVWDFSFAGFHNRSFSTSINLQIPIFFLGKNVIFLHKLNQKKKKTVRETKLKSKSLIWFFFYVGKKIKTHCMNTKLIK